MPLVAPPASALSNIVPFSRSPVSPFNVPSSGKLLGGLGALGLIVGAVDLIGELGANKWRDDLLGKIPSKNRVVSNGTPCTWDIAVSGDSYNVEPFSGTGSISISGYSNDKFKVVKGSASPVENYFGYLISINADTPQQRDPIQISVSAPRFGDGFLGSPTIDPQIRRDNQGQIIPPTNPLPETGSSTPYQEQPTSNGLSNPNALLGSALGSALGSKSPFKDLTPKQNDRNKLAPSPSGFAPASPQTSPPNNPNTQPNTAPKSPSEQEKENQKKRQEEEKKAALPNLSNRDSQSILNELIRIGAISSAINTNTQPSAQRLNAKNGTCDALNSPSCTQGMEDRIKDPIQAKQDNLNKRLFGNQILQDGLLGTILVKITDVFNLVGGLWNNGIVDKAMQYITMITVIHNAAMLTRGIADTLGSALDLGLQAFGLQIKDKDGNQLGVNQVIGKSFENLIKGIIGADNYTALTQTWVQANRIYQTGINLISNVQNILDSTTAVAELTSNRVGTLMNALRNAGMVRENAYGAQSQNVTRFNAFQNKLEALEQGVSNTASIAGNIVSVQQSVNEIKSNRQEFENALKNKPQGSGLPENDPEKQATQQKKDQSIYTISDFSVVKPPETP